MQPSFPYEFSVVMKATQVNDTVTVVGTIVGELMDRYELTWTYGAKYYPAPTDSFGTWELVTFYFKHEKAMFLARLAVNG